MRADGGRRRGPLALVAASPRSTVRGPTVSGLLGGTAPRRRAGVRRPAGSAKRGAGTRRNRVPAVPG